MGLTVRRAIAGLELYENKDDLAHQLAYPTNWAMHRLPHSTAERESQSRQYGPEELAIKRALVRWGMKDTSVTVVPANKGIF